MVEFLACVIGTRVAGALAKAGDVSGRAVTDAYDVLRALIVRKFDKGGAVQSVKDEPRSETAQAALAETLAKALQSVDDEPRSETAWAALTEALAQAFPASNVPSEVQALIRSEQERSYRNLAIKLGLGADPHKAYERLAGSPPSAESHSSYETNHFQIRFQILVMLHLFIIKKALIGAGVPWTGPEPALATLPSGQVSAQVRIEPVTRMPVMFFEQGLFDFLYDYCHLIGWAVPPISPSQLADDKALMGMVHRYTMAFQASESFTDAMCAYVFEGNPLVGRHKVPPPPHNISLCIKLLSLMERFVMCHEMAHIKGGHLANPSGRKAEFEADLSSLRLVTYMTIDDGVGWGLGYWACELAVLAFNLLYRSIRVAAFGAKDVIWTDQAHPEPVVRRDMLRKIWLDPDMPKTGIMAARELTGMSDALIQLLWESISIPLLMSHQKGLRPSPMWQPLIDATFAERI